MTIFKANDGVRVKPNAYNITDRRIGMLAIVTQIDLDSTALPVRIEYQDGNFNWTNHESLELVTEAPSKNAEVGAEILNRMLLLKQAIVIRDNAVKNVVEQTEALDALLAQYGLKRGEEIPPIPVRVQAGPRTALDDVADKSVKEGMKYRCTSDDVDYFTKNEIYKVVALDLRDNHQPISFNDEDGDEMFPDRHELASFIRVI